jgi:hypothetical protein
MSLNTLSIDGQANTALLILRTPGGVEFTRFTYVAGNVTFSARPAPIVTNVAGLEAIGFDVSRFKLAVADIIGPASVPRPNYAEEYEGETTKLKFKFKFGGGTLVTDAQYVDTTQTITFKPRLEVVLTWAEFLAFERAQIMFVSRCSNHF